MFLFSVIDLRPLDLVFLLQPLHSHLVVLFVVCLLEHLFVFLLLHLHLQLLFEFIVIPVSVFLLLQCKHLLELFPPLLLLPDLSINLELLLLCLVLDGDTGSPVDDHFDPLFPLVLLREPLLVVNVHLLLLVAECVDLLLFQGLLEQHLALED